MGGEGGVCSCVGEWGWVWVGGRVLLNYVVFVIEDVQVFSPYSEH